ncbi:hypothetical protein [Streptococcus macacae]|uniref:Uncharacterized protein n=1 Tax=Streptococcus macacae NCTC 11558 TaxID=764298 RepID=G5JVS0_9STRE|nr:hypothetical protein [Streptococcus macacae]EHJ52601.1 hypothetical protein STRMA_0926 [Streptococcus macacae NCTC 11558]SUN78736.1 Uncharacterised protein [Streptococcus macacae NCTC 11558]
MVTDKDDNKTVKEVYHVDSRKADNPVRKGDTVVEGQYKVKDNTNIKEKQFRRNENILASFFMLSYFWLLICLYSWDGGTIIFISIFTFGLPLLYYGFPFLSIIMLTNNKLTISIGYLSSLTAIFYLIFALSNFPLKQITDEAGHTATLTYWHSFSVILSIIVFLLIATLLFLYKIFQGRCPWKNGKSH